MGIFNSLKAIANQTKDRYKDRRNEKGFHYLQHSGASILQQANLNGQSYRQNLPRKNELTKSFRERMEEKKKSMEENRG